MSNLTMLTMALATAKSGMKLMDIYYVGFNHPDNYKGLDPQLIYGRLLRIEELLKKELKE